jgi:hypothetical protein
MRFTDPMDDLFGQRSKVRILRYLAGGRESAGREIARAIGFDHKTCHAALRQLLAHGVVLARSAGKATMYRLNGDSLLTKRIILPAVAAESRLTADLGKFISSVIGRGIESIVLFGSVARSQELPTSDVDALVICVSKSAAEKAARAVEDAGPRFLRTFGNMPSIICVDAGAFVSGIRNGNRLFREIARTGRAILGKSISEVLTRCRRRGLTTRASQRKTRLSTSARRKSSSAR